MTPPDCSDLGNCAIPMWFQYVLVAFAFVMLTIKCFAKKDPYDRN